MARTVLACQVVIYFLGSEVFSPWLKRKSRTAGQSHNALVVGDNARGRGGLDKPPVFQQAVRPGPARRAPQINRRAWRLRLPSA